MTDSKWRDDAFLDRLRASTDIEADRAVARLIESHGIAKANRLFAGLHADDEPLPGDTPPALREFLAETGELPDWADRKRLEAAGHEFLAEASAAAIVMLASSLPQGYAAPCLCEILTISKNLENHPFKRLMGVIQLLVNVAQPGAWEPGGLATVTAQKLRLLHAGVRTVVPKHRPQFREKYGLPINHEDMLATIMAFSWLVVEGLRKLEVPLEDEGEYYALWRTFAVMMGIHPPGRPHDDSYVPGNLEEAEAFYQSYSRRQFTMPDENPSGPLLAQENLEMMEQLIPRALRRIGLDNGPRIAMTELLGPEALARVGMSPERDHPLERRLLGELVKLAEHELEHVPGFSALLSRLVFKAMIHHGRGGEVTFVIPDSLESLRGPGLV